MSHFIEKCDSYSRKKHCAIIPSNVYYIPLQKGYLVRMVRYRESETKWSPGSDPAYSGSTVLTIPSADNYPSHWINNFNWYICSWQNPHIGSLTFSVRSIMLIKAKRKLWKFPYSYKIINHKLYYIILGITVSDVILKYIKDTGVIVLILAYNLPVWPLIKLDHSGLLQTLLIILMKLLYWMCIFIAEN